MSVLELCQLVDEFVDALKVAVDACKTNVRHRVEAAELVQNVLAEPRRWNLLLASVDEPAFDLMLKTLERLSRDRTLHAGPPEPGQQLRTIVGLPAPVVLDDERQRLLDPFVGGVSAAAMLALTPPSGDLARLRQARVNHTVFEGSAVGAAHIGEDASAAQVPEQRSARGSVANQADEGLQVRRLGEHVETD